jgi:glycosyltransferase involved in cell wall biosynthesis
MRTSGARVCLKLPVRLLPRPRHLPRPGCPAPRMGRGMVTRLRTRQNRGARTIATRRQAQHVAATARLPSVERVLIVDYDDQIFVSQRRGGISRYFVELIRALSDAPELDVQAHLGWRWTRNAHALEAGLGSRLRIPGGTRGFVLRRANRMAGVTRCRPDLMHPTYYGASYLRRERSCPLVVTVHDMMPELFPNLFPSGNPHQEKQDYVRRASLVLCISESTRRDLIKVYGPIASPTVVTHLGVSSRFASGALRPAWLPDEYLLFLGTRSGYKDFLVALESFAELAPKQPGTALLTIGGGPFGEGEEALIARWGLRNRVFQHESSDEELPGILSGASAFVLPSRYEGFGLPTLEAMACGTPVVLADSSALPEVGGDAALYFAPGDSSALAAELLRLLSDPELQSVLSRRGRKRAARFTWRQTAERTAAAYRIVASREPA